MFLHVLLWGAICAKSQHNATFTRIKNIKKHRNKVGDDTQSWPSFCSTPCPDWRCNSPLGRIPPLSDPGTRDTTQRGGRGPQRGMYVCSSTTCNHITISSAPSDWLFLVPIRSVHGGDSNWYGQTRRVGTALSVGYQPSSLLYQHQFRMCVNFRMLWTRHSLVPRPHPAYHRLQYRWAGFSLQVTISLGGAWERG